MACRPARSAIPFPTSVEPVKVIEPGARMLDQGASHAPPGAGHDVENPPRQPGGREMLGEPERRERRRARRLHDDGVAGRERGRDLVGEQVQREVERADRDHDPNRVADREEEPVLVPRGSLVGVRGEALAAQMPDLLGGQTVHPDRAVDLDPGVDDRFPDLVRDQVGQRLPVGREPVRGRPEDPGALVTRGRAPALLALGGRRRPRRSPPP